MLTALRAPRLPKSGCELGLSSFILFLIYFSSVSVYFSEGVREKPHSRPSRAKRRVRESRRSRQARAPDICARCGVGRCCVESRVGKDETRLSRWCPTPRRPLFKRSRGLINHLRISLSTRDARETHGRYPAPFVSQSRARAPHDLRCVAVYRDALRRQCPTATQM